MRSWTVTAAGIRVESRNDALPKQIDQIRKYVERRGGNVPIEPFLSSVEYDERKPETVLAAAYAWLKEQTELEPRVDTTGIRLPVNDRETSGVIH